MAKANKKSKRKSKSGTVWHKARQSSFEVKRPEPKTLEELFGY